MTAAGDEGVGSTPAVGDPVWVAWREGTLTRAAELEALARWTSRAEAPGAPVGGTGDDDLRRAVASHLRAAREAAAKRRWFERRHTGARLERAMSNLDAAEAHLLQIAPPSYLLGQVPSLLNHVQRHLRPADPRRREMERIAKRFGLDEGSPPRRAPVDDEQRAAQRDEIAQERGRIVSAVRGASSAALREQTRVHSFRNVLVVSTVAMAAVALFLGLVGWRSPATIPLCFAPEAAGQTTIVCPTEQSGPMPTPGAAGSAAGGPAPAPAPATGSEGGPGTSGDDIDTVVAETAAPGDLLLVELIGVTAAGVAAAGAMRGIRGSSEPYGVPIAVALLKLPTGAVTAVLGLLLMRGEFIPGLSALDTSAQILAWAIVFGYAQQLFTRLVDQQAHDVLDGVRGGPKAAEAERSG